VFRRAAAGSSRHPDQKFTEAPPVLHSLAHTQIDRELLQLSDPLSEELEMQGLDQQPARLVALQPAARRQRLRRTFGALAVRAIERCVIAIASVAVPLVTWFLLHK
jgi:hypothetical protein